MKGSRPRATPLFETAVREASIALTAALSEEDIALRRTRPVVEATVRAYLAVAKDEEARRHTGNISPLTRDIAALDIGQSLLADAIVRKGFNNSRLKAVRNLMDNQHAMFFCRSTGPNVPAGKIRVTRAQDGARPGWEPTRNRKAVELAAMRPGEAIISREIRSLRGKGQMCTSTKNAARKILGDANANWRVREVKDGIRVERIC